MNNIDRLSFNKTSVLGGLAASLVHPLYVSRTIQKTDLISSSVAITTGLNRVDLACRPLSLIEADQAGYREPPYHHETI
jgi:hypothetical protein